MQFKPGSLHYFFATVIAIFTNCNSGIAQLLSEPGTHQHFTSITSFRRDTLTIRKDLEAAAGLVQRYPDSAIKKYREVLDNSRIIQYASGEATALNSIGKVYNRKGQYDSAIFYLKNALSFAANRKDLVEMLPLLHVGMAEAYQSKGDYESAVQAFYHALAANKNSPPGMRRDKEEANINIALAAIFSLLKQYGKASLYLDRSSLLAQKHSDFKLQANVLLQKGIITCEQPGKLPESIRYFEEALTLAQKNQFRNIEFVAMSNLGTSYYLSNNMAKALSQAEKTSVLIDKGYAGNVYHRIGAIISIGEIYLAAKQYDKAELNLIDGLARAEKLGTELNQLEAHVLLYKLYKERGMFKKALEHHETYARLEDQLGGRDVNKYVNELEVKYRTAEKDKSIINKQLLIERQNNKINRGKTINNIGIAIALALLLCFALLIRLYRNRSLLRKKKVEILEQAQEITQLKGIVQGEQGERLRIAGELHDGIGGILATLKMKFGNARKRNPAWADNKTFGEIDYLIEHTANEIRRASHNLMPDALTKYSLKDALIMYRDDVCMEVEDLAIEMLFIGDEMDGINNTMNLIIYRMVQEIIQNILKHSNARQAVIQIVYKDKRIKIIAEDDGKGFDLFADHAGIGIKTLQSRVSALRGNITINTAIGKGTTIFIELDTNIMT
jgi:signal transduction histidine kinase